MDMPALEKYLVGQGGQLVDAEAAFDTVPVVAWKNQ